MISEEVQACLQGFSPGFFLRIAEDPGRDQREADGMALIFLGQTQRVLIGRIQQLRFMVLSIQVDRSDRMDDVL